MKKLILGLGLALLGSFSAQAQGLEGIVVEKYYVSNAADAAGSVGTLPAGSVTYRVYADMLPGYKFQALYGVSNHTLTISTSTSFFNNEDRGAIVPNGITVTNTRKNTVMIDSWFSVGATATGKMGVLKTDDTDGSIGNADGILQNNDASAGIPIMTQDGMLPGTAEAVTFVGLTTELDVFDATSQLGNLFTTTNGSVASLNGSTGPNAANRVLLGQFTTDGVFGFELNIQIGTPIGGTENYVARNPQGGEISIPSLILAPNLPPTVDITAPANGSNFVTGDVVTIDATATDADGTVTGVEFFVDGASVGVDNSAPYTANYTSVVGTHTLTAVGTDNSGDDGTSSAVIINVNSNQAPSISVSAPATAVVGDIVTIDATTSDVDGTVDSVRFFVDNIYIGTDASSPFSMDWTATVGTHNLKGTAWDDRGASTTSAIIQCVVSNNIPPTAVITAPSAGSAFTAPAIVTIEATATDADGTVDSVEFFVNNIKIGSDLTAPFSYDWTSVIGSANLTVKSTDDKGAVTTSAGVLISILDPNALPYRVDTKEEMCQGNSFCLPLTAMDTVNDVIGYDVVMNYDINKLTPTGVVTLSSDLINPSYVDVVNSIDGVNGLINISAYFNSSAPSNAEFTGAGTLFCVEFTKTANFTSVDTSVVSVSSLQESYFTGVNSKLVESGKYITFRDSIFSGKLDFWLDNSPIKYNTGNPNDYVITNIYGNNSNCDDQSVEAVNPDLFGQFNYNTANGLYVDINKDILGITDVQPVINGFDAFKTRQVLLNDASYTPSVFEIIAMDVNLDGAVSAGDVSQINQRAVLMVPEFKQAWNYDAQGVSNGQPSKDWLFLDSTITLLTDAAYQISATYPANDGLGYSKSRVPVAPFCLEVPLSNYPDCPLISDEVYKGILVADVNGNYSTFNSGPNQFKQGSNEKVIFDITNAAIKGSYVEIPVSILSSKNINALDFSMKFNEGNLVFSSVIDHTTYMQSLSNFNADDRTLRFTSNSMQNYEKGKQVVSVRFALNGQFSAADLQSVTGYLNGDKVAVEFSGITGISTISNDNLVSFYPNPATDILNVMVIQDATVELYDVNGKIIVSTIVNANQKQEISTADIAPGVYMLKVYNDTFVSTKRVVVNK